jgi:hypothetical protein
MIINSPIASRFANSEAPPVAHTLPKEVELCIQRQRVVPLNPSAVAALATIESLFTLQLSLPTNGP